MGLQEVWFVLVAVLFIGYFVLEGFDFGVGMLMPIVGRGSDLPADTRRRWRSTRSARCGTATRCG